MNIKKGEIWKVKSRGFDGVIKVLEDIRTEEDYFFEAEIVEGVKTYLCAGRDEEIKGDKIVIRTTITDFIERECLCGNKCMEECDVCEECK